MFTSGSRENNLCDMGESLLIDLAHGKFLGYQRNKTEQFY